MQYFPAWSWPPPKLGRSCCPAHCATPPLWQCSCLIRWETCRKPRLRATSGPRCKEGQQAWGLPAHPLGRCTACSSCRSWADLPAGELPHRTVLRLVHTAGWQPRTAVALRAQDSPCRSHPSLLLTLPGSQSMPETSPCLAGWAQGLHRRASGCAYPGAGAPLPWAGHHAKLSVAGGSTSSTCAVQLGNFASGQAERAGQAT